MPFFIAPRGALRLTFIVATCVAASACSTFNDATGHIGGIVSAYRPEVVQGNFVSKEQKDALQIGMQRVQVRDILGSPLVASAFHADRWEYVFTIRRQGVEPQQRKLTVFFKGDDLTKVESDELPSEQEFVTSLSSGRKLGSTPVLEIAPEQLKALGAPASPTNPSNAGALSPARAYPPLESPTRP